MVHQSALHLYLKPLFNGQNLTCFQASEHGNADAKDRLQALSQPMPQSLSRDEHKTLTDTTLVRKRTQAKQRSDASGAFAGRATASAAQTTQIMENVRKNSLLGRPPPGSSSKAGYNAPQTNSPPEMGRPTPLPPVDEPRTSSIPIPVSASASMPNSTNPRMRQSYGSGPAPAPAAASAYAPSPLSTPLSSSPAPGGSARPYANATRYSLADPGSGSAPRPNLSNSPMPSGTPPLRRPGEGGRLAEPAGYSGKGGSAAHAPKPAGPQTFAEMGIASTKVQDDGCVVM